MPTPEFAQALFDLGGFALCLFGVIVFLFALWKRILVFGFFYDEERAGRQVSDTQAEQNTATLTAQTAVMGEQTKELAGLREEVRGLRSELRDERLRGGRDG